MDNDLFLDSLSDNHIRSALRTELAVEYATEPDSVVFDEFVVGHGAARVDIAVVGSSLAGFEIKSDLDTLERLPRQVRFYNSVFDHVTLLVGYRHAYEALQIIPLWWGVRLVEMKSNGTVEIADAREPRCNPAPDPLSVVELLWREEALGILEARGHAHGFRSKPRAAVYRRIVEILSFEEIRLLVCQQLKSRTGWRSDAELA